MLSYPDPRASRHFLLEIQASLLPLLTPALRIALTTSVAVMQTIAPFVTGPSCSLKYGGLPLRDFCKHGRVLQPCFPFPSLPTTRATRERGLPLGTSQRKGLSSTVMPRATSKRAAL